MTFDVRSVKNAWEDGETPSLKEAGRAHREGMCMAPHGVKAVSDMGECMGMLIVSFLTIFDPQDGTDVSLTSSAAEASCKTVKYVMLS